MGHSLSRVRIRSRPMTTQAPKNFVWDIVGLVGVGGKGRLLPVIRSSYQTAVSIEIVAGTSNLAHRTGRELLARSFTKHFAQQKPRMNEASGADKREFAVCPLTETACWDDPIGLATVPMLFGLLETRRGRA